VEEVRRQFREIPGLLEGKPGVKPDSARCVDISTTAALREMILPGVASVLLPVVVGKVLGVKALGGLLAGATVTGVMMALFMANAGGAWDNAKKARAPTRTRPPSWATPWATRSRTPAVRR